MSVLRCLPRLVVVSIAMLLTACASKPLQVRDLTSAESTWMQGRRTAAEGTKLKMTFVSDSERLRIERVDYKVHNGDLYLWPVRASSTFEPVEFTLDTADLKLKQPWQDHVYWVGAVNWDGFLGHLANPDPLGDRVDRVHAEVTSEAGQ